MHPTLRGEQRTATHAEQAARTENEFKSTLKSQSINKGIIRALQKHTTQSHPPNKRPRMGTTQALNRCATLATWLFLTSISARLTPPTPLSGR
jgi:hypothetical protein